jgi:hypothetical protein
MNAQCPQYYFCKAARGKFIAAVTVAVAVLLVADRA